MIFRGFMLLFAVLIFFLVVSSSSTSLNERSMDTADFEHEERFFDQDMPEERPNMHMKMKMSGGLPAGVNNNFDSKSKQQQASQSSRKIQRNANIHGVVNDVKAALHKFSAQVETSGGYVVYSSMMGNSSLTFNARVPSDQLDSFTDYIRANCLEISMFSVRGNDVTMEFVDTEARTANLQEAHKRLLELLKQGSKVSDLLEVQRELTRVTSDLESHKARLTYLRETVDFSLIEGQFSIPWRQSEPPTPPTRWQTWSVAKTFERASSSLTSFFILVVDVAIYVLVFLIPLSIVAFFLIVISRRFS